MATRNGPRMLVVEDDPGIRALLAVMLQGQGCAVEFASDGPAGLAAMARERPAVVLVDMVMPGMSGPAFVRRCHADPGCSGVPMILVSGRPDVHDVAASLQGQGVVGTLEKPFSVAALYAVVDRFVPRARPSR